MSTEIIACPNCGFRNFGEDFSLTARTIRCPACTTHFVTELGRRLAERDAAETAKLENLNRQLKDAVSHDDVDTVISRSQEILSVNPEDYGARYYFAYGKRRRSEAGYIKEFYASPVSETATEETVRSLIMHMACHCEFSDWGAVEAYIRATGYPDAEELIATFKEIYEDRLQRESDYMDCERDVFICHSSRDRETVDKVLAVVENAGRTAWISSRNLRPNDSENYWAAIKRAIHSCRILLLVYSDNSARSTDVMKEIEIAYQEKKKIVEINVDGTEHRKGSIFHRVLDGLAWVDGFSGGLDAGLATLGDRLFDTLVNLPAGVEIDLDEGLSVAEDLKSYEPTYDNARLLLEKGKDMGLGEDYKIAAYRLFALCAKQDGDPRAWFGVALCYYYGYGVEKNEEKGTRIFGEHYEAISKMAEEGDAEAAYILYEYYNDSLGVFEDLNAAFKWLMNAAEHGSLRAAHTVATMTFDPRQAADNMEKAYKGGYHLAAYDWANLLFNGSTAVREDRNEAIRIYNEAAKAGDERCRRRLAEAAQYKNGFEIFEGQLQKINDQVSLSDGTLVLPREVTSVAPRALAGVKGMRVLRLPEAVTELPDDAFGTDTPPEIHGPGIKADAVTERIRGAVEQEKKETERKIKKERGEKRAEATAAAFSRLLHPYAWFCLAVILVGAVAALGASLDFIALPNTAMCVLYAVSAVLALGLFCYLAFVKRKNFYAPDCRKSDRTASLTLFIPFLLSAVGIVFGGAIDARYSAIIAAVMILLVGIACKVVLGSAFVFPIAAILLVSVVVPFGVVFDLFALDIGIAFAIFAGVFGLAALVFAFISAMGYAPKDAISAALYSIGFLLCAALFFFGGLLVWWGTMIALAVTVAYLLVTVLYANK